jgi:UDP:flavonoid glycosyltransferase YjiC (YdhE family)
VRILFSAHGAYGHVLPLIALARALQDSGHEVRVAVGRRICSVVESLGLASVAAGIDDGELGAEARRRWPETTRQPPAKWAIRMFTDIAAPAMADDLVDLIRAWPPDLIVREEGEYAAPIVAQRYGVRWITHGWGSPLPPHEQLERLPQLLAPLARRHGLEPPPDATQLYGGAVLDPCPPSLYVEPPAVVPRPVRPIPHELAADGSEPVEVPPGPLAYIGFGTVPRYRDQTELLAAAAQAVLSVGLGAVITTSDAAGAARLRALDPTRIRVTDWVSLPRLLPACSLVISHGGAGTALAALAHGIPQLLLPGGAPSQLRTSRACAARGLARAIEPDAATLTAITEAVGDLMASSAYGDAAREVADEIASLPHPSQTARHLT